MGKQNNFALTFPNSLTYLNPSELLCQLLHAISETPLILRITSSSFRHGYSRPNRHPRWEQPICAIQAGVTGRICGRKGALGSILSPASKLTAVQSSLVLRFVKVSCYLPGTSSVDI